MTVDTTASKSGATGGASNQSNGSSSGNQTGANVASSPSSNSNTNVIKKNRSEVIRTIQDITKVDEYTINQAIEACQDSEGKYSMDQVLNILMDEKYSNEQNQEQNSKKYNRQTAHDPSQNDNNKYSPMNKNLNNSSNLYGVTNNLDDDDEDEYDTVSSLLREDGKPAGLKNVGNTCWFNSIIQAFFHLPYFRRIILSFQIDQNEINRLDENSKNVVQFVIELRKLFALMSNSKRKSINPNQTLKCLSQCSKYDVFTFNQEDVSEFATILVNLIEESFDILFKLQQSNMIAPLAPKEDILPSSPGATSNLETIETHLNEVDSLVDNLNNLNVNNKQPFGETTKTINLNNLNLRKNRKNPIVKLLNGDILINRKKSDEDETHSIMEIFREINIQMLNSRNLHAGLELEWGETSIDKLTTNSSSASTSTTTTITNTISNATNQSLNQTSIANITTNKSLYEQESWIVNLPSVLFVCLNRYKFVKATQSSSKILEPFEFYPYIYLDRYMHTNRELIKTKRKELKQLNAELKRLESKLNMIKNYKHEDNTNKSNYYALDDVLKCAYHFATQDFSSNDVFDNIKPVFGVEDAPETEQVLVQDEAQMSIVQNCLKNWIKQIEAKINQLNTSINELKAKIDKIYDNEDLKKIKYNLHSVCIHEGNATSGHFWTYIWNMQQLKWYKFNDTEVCESTWDDLYENAVGGGSSKTNTGLNDLSSSKTEHKSNLFTTIGDNADSDVKQATTKPNERTPSAYFLIYTKADDPNLYNETCKLNTDLIKFLNDDQKALNETLNNLKLKMFLRETTETLKKSNLELQAANINTSGTATEQNNQTCIEHAKAFNDSTLEALTSSFDRILTTKDDNYGIEDALKHAINLELNKYTDETREVLNKLPDMDLRMNHILIYFNCNNVSRDLKILALYDIFRMQIFPDNDIKLKILQTLAQIKYNEYLLATVVTAQTQQPSSPVVSTKINTVNTSGTTIPITILPQSQTQTPAISSSVIKNYEKWQSDYRDFRSIIAAFINAGNFMESQRYEEAVPFFCVACEYNERITGNFTFKMKGMDHEFLLANRRKCLKLWNQSTIKKLTQKNTSANQLNQQELTNLIETMINKFLPCFFRLAGSTKEDKEMIEEIRQDWLNVLDSNLPELQIFHEFMTKIFEDPVTNHYHSLNVNKTNLSNRYKEIVQNIQKIK